MPLNREALRTIVNYRLTQRATQEARDTEERAFQRKLQLLGIEAGVKAGEILPSFDGGQFKGFTGRDASQAASRIPTGVSPTSFLQRQLLETSLAPPSVFEAQAMQTLPMPPFVPGPAGSFMTSPQVLTPGEHFAPGVEIAPSRLGSRAMGLAEGIRGQQAVELGPQLRQQRLEELQQAGELAGVLTPAFQNITTLPQQGGQPTTIQVPRGLVKTPPALSDTAAFRKDIQESLEAIRRGRISNEEAIRLLLEAYPDKANKILELQQLIF